MWSQRRIQIGGQPYLVNVKRHVEKVTLGEVGFKNFICLNS